MENNLQKSTEQQQQQQQLCFWCKASITYAES
jgi:hypothetical protein